MGLTIYDDVVDDLVIAPTIGDLSLYSKKSSDKLNDVRRSYVDYSLGSS